MHQFLPPDHTIENNLEAWSRYDWSQFGDEWSNTPEWKASLVEHVMLPHLPENGRILEIGPGGGRWTEYLAQQAKELLLVDLTPKCIKICKQRFQQYDHIKYYVNDGKSLGFVDDNSIDFVWSFDVFVHILAKDTFFYLREIKRVLRTGGNAIIHHSKNGRTTYGWRSDMTKELMQQFCNELGLEVLDQIESWDEGRRRIWPKLPAKNCLDVISLLHKTA